MNIKTLTESSLRLSPNSEYPKKVVSSKSYLVTKNPQIAEIEILISVEPTAILFTRVGWIPDWNQETAAVAANKAGGSKAISVSSF
jgi:hypothetical protein